MHYYHLKFKDCIKKEHKVIIAPNSEHILKYGCTVIKFGMLRRPNINL